MCRLDKFFRFLVIFSLLWLSFESRGQSLIITGNEETQKKIERYSYQKESVDSAAARKILDQLITSWQIEGYFSANAILEKINEDTLLATLDLGKQYKWVYLNAATLDPVMLEKVHFREKVFLQKPFHYEELRDLFEHILRYSENTGYPFAHVRLTEVQIQEGELYARLQYDPGPYIAFGELQVRGTDRVKTDFLAAYLNVLAGREYDERQVSRISERLRRLPFITLAAPVEMAFQNQQADILLTLADEKSNEFDGLINFFPSEGKERKMLLTGELNIQLNNLFKRGKAFELRWQRLQIQSQRLLISYQHPNLFHSAVGAGFHFQLFKEDTLFINRDLSLALFLPVGTNHQLQSEIKRQSSRVTGLIGEENYGNEIANFDLTSLSLGYTWQHLDNSIMPSKGYKFSISASIGSKHVFPETTGSQNQNSEYLGHSWQKSFRGTCYQYHRLSNSWVLFHRLEGGWLINERLFLSDLYRLGGLHTIRGFYDNFFFASQYGLSNVELRLLFEEKHNTHSYLFAFYDQALMINHQYTKDYPAGVGAGISLHTSAGLFNLVYGIGSSQSQPFDLNLSKIHFGYVSRF